MAAIATPEVFIAGALAVAYFTSRWQVRADTRRCALVSRFALYDEVSRLLFEVETAPALSLDEPRENEEACRALAADCELPVAQIRTARERIVGQIRSEYGFGTQWAASV